MSIECRQNKDLLETDPEEKRILLVGKCVIDYILICKEYPSEDSDKRALDGYWQRGGNASNNATVLGQFKAPVEFFGVLSDRPAFAFLLDDCRKRGIYFEHCPKVDSDPPFSSVMLSKASGSRTIVHCAHNFPEISFKDFQAIKDLSRYRWAHFEARNIDETYKILTALREYNSKQDDNEKKIIISVDLENLSEKVFRLASLADYNILGKDLAKFMGWSDPIAACKGLRSYLSKEEEKNGFKSVIIAPWSDKGACYMDTDDKIEMKPAYSPPAIVDSLGAGDTFCASFIYSKAIRKTTLSEAIDFGNRVAGFKLGHRGYDAIREMFNS